MLLPFFSIFFLLHVYSLPQTQHWFPSQRLDHFSPFSTSIIFSQRFWSISEYFDSQSGPVFLYICGEYTCPGLPEERQYPLKLANKYKALILVLEHRYYGASMPLGEESLKSENLKYLTVEQALADLAYFIKYSKDEKLFGLSEVNPWITIGGSYPGALSAWFRSKYPYLTIGALASSAVVKAIEAFPEFDRQVYLSLKKSSLSCAGSVQNLTSFVQNMLKENPESIKKQFLAEMLTNEEFLFFFADIFVELVQYGRRTFLCDLISNKTLSAQLSSIINYVIDSKFSAQSYGSYFLNNASVDVNRGDRQWTFQTCTQVGFFQVKTPGEEGMRSNDVNLPFYRKWCEDSFGKKLWPDVNLTNLNLGGFDLKTTNIIFTNGGEDPWQWAGIRKDKDGMRAILIDCDDCAHCVELYTEKVEDSDILKNARKEIEERMDSWIEEYWKNKMVVIEKKETEGRFLE